MSNNNDKRICHNCNKPGHLARQCKSKAGGKTGGRKGGTRYVKKVDSIVKAISHDFEKLQGERDALNEIREERENEKEEKTEEGRRHLEDVLIAKIDSALDEKRHREAREKSDEQGASNAFRKRMYKMFNGKRLVQFTVPRKKLSFESEKVIIPDVHYSTLMAMRALLAVLLLATFAFSISSVSSYLGVLISVQNHTCLIGNFVCDHYSKGADCHTDFVRDCVILNCTNSSIYEDYSQCKKLCWIESFNYCLGNIKTIDNRCHSRFKQKCMSHYYADNYEMISFILFGCLLIMFYLVLFYKIALSIYTGQYQMGVTKKQIRKKQLNVKFIDCEAPFGGKGLPKDLRPVHQQRVDLIENDPLIMTIKLKYYESLKTYTKKSKNFLETDFLHLAPKKSELIKSEYRTVHSDTVKIHYQLFKELIKHSNSKIGLNPEQIKDKMDQLAAYTGFYNWNGYELSHIIQDTVLIAQLYAKHNRTNGVHERLFLSALVD